MKPHFDIDKIKFSTDEETYKRAVNLYKSGRVTEFKEDFGGFSAIVLGTSPYAVFVGERRHDTGSCKCYLGQNETLCKHMVAVAIFALLRGRPLKNQDVEVIYKPRCSGRVGELSEEQATDIEKSISLALKLIKPYRGPSKVWFAYQDSLFEGCNRLSSIISKLPVGEKTANLVVKLALQLDKKLTSDGVDDSDGTVSGLIEETVLVLKEHSRLKSSCITSFKQLLNRKTCFGWEEPLLKMYKQTQINRKI